MPVCSISVVVVFQFFFYCDSTLCIPWWILFLCDVVFFFSLRCGACVFFARRLLLCARLHFAVLCSVAAGRWNDAEGLPSVFCAAAVRGGPAGGSVVYSPAETPGAAQNPRNFSVLREAAGVISRRLVPLRWCHFFFFVVHIAACIWAMMPPFLFFSLCVAVPG